MALSDFLLRARVNLALIRDSRVASLDVGVHVNAGSVTLTGDLDSEKEVDAAVDITRGVEGVESVINEMTCGLGKGEDTADLVAQKLLEKLDDEWHALPDQSSKVQADYLRWALWIVHKFSLPATMPDETRIPAENNTVELALGHISSLVNVPKVMLVIEMQRQAEQVASSPRLEAPETEMISLVSSPAGVDSDSDESAAETRNRSL